MGREENCRGMDEAVAQIAFEGELIEKGPYGSGHINDTFCLIYRQEDGSSRRYILQHMNKEIFTKPEELMENIIGVTSYLRKRIIEQGGDPERETLNLIPTKTGKMYFCGFLRGILESLRVYRGCVQLRFCRETGRLLRKCSRIWTFPADAG